MKVNAKRIIFERKVRDEYGNIENRLAKHINLRRDLVADLDGKYSYSLVDLWIILEAEKMGGNGHFTSLECCLRLPALQAEFRREFGITIPDGQKGAKILLPFNNSLGLGKIEPQDMELIVEIRDNDRLLLSQTIPVSLDIKAPVY